VLLRGCGQAASALTLQLTFAGGGRWEKTRRLPKPSAHDDDLRTLSCTEICGVPDARVTVLAKEIHQNHGSTP
jgi:DNA polymerase-4